MTEPTSGPETFQTVGAIFGIIGAVLGSMISIFLLRDKMRSSLFPLSLTVFQAPKQVDDNHIEVGLSYKKYVMQPLSDFYMEIMTGEYKNEKLKPMLSPSTIPKGVHEVVEDITIVEEGKGEWSLLQRFYSPDISITELAGCKLKVVAKVGIRQGLGFWTLHSIKKVVGKLDNRDLP